MRPEGEFTVDLSDYLLEPRRRTPRPIRHRQIIRARLMERKCVFCWGTAKWRGYSCGLCGGTGQIPAPGRQVGEGYWRHTA